MEMYLHHLNAVNMQDKLNFKNCNITSVINVEYCHTITLSMVDLQKGEKVSFISLCGAAYVFTTTARYANSDYALVMTLRHGYALKYIVTTYNIVCQYGIHIVEQFQKNFPDLTDGIGRIEFLVLKLHLQAHKDNWQYWYSQMLKECTVRVLRQDGQHIMKRVGLPKRWIMAIGITR